MLNGKKVGLHRFIYANGFISFMIYDKEGERSESKLFDATFNIVDEFQKTED